MSSGTFWVPGVWQRAGDPPKTGNHTGGAGEGGYLPGCATSELQGDGQVTSISELRLLLIK